jgi:hypothetical protein
MTFYVIDTVDRSVSWPAKEDAKMGERFASRKAAEARAKTLAEYEPGKMFEVVESISEVECPVGDPKVTKRR